MPNNRTIEETVKTALKVENQTMTEITDSRVGAILDDEGELVTIPTVVDSFRTCDLSFAYPPIEGFKTFRERVTSWVLGPDLKVAKENHNLMSFSTVGGTTALWLAFRFAHIYGLEVLIPDLGRPCYTDLCNGASAYYRKYTVLDRENSFNLQAISDIIQEDKNKFKGFLLLINDPCQNPTGHSLSEDESKALFDLISRTNRLGATRVALLWDTCYLSFAQKRPAWLSLAAQANEAFTSLIAFSCSKNFAVYGMRVGMLLGILPKGDETLQDVMFNIFAKSVKQSYVVPDGLGMSALSYMLTADRAKKIRAELAPIAKTLTARGARMMAALDDQEIAYIPYQEGFYLTAICTANPDIVSDCLEQRKVFLYPLQPKYLRISIAALRPGQEKTIARAIKLAQAKAQDSEEIRKLRAVQAEQAAKHQSR